MRIFKFIINCQVKYQSIVWVVRVYYDGKVKALEQGAQAVIDLTDINSKDVVFLTDSHSTWNKKISQLHSSRKKMKNRFRANKIPDDYHTLDRPGYTNSYTYWSQQTQFTQRDEASDITTMYL